MKKVVLITVASSGMGKSTAEILIAQGHKVYGAARRVERMQDLADKGMGLVVLDLTDEDSIKAAVKEVELTTPPGTTHWVGIWPKGPVIEGALGGKAMVQSV